MDTTLLQSFHSALEFTFSFSVAHPSCILSPFGELSDGVSRKEVVFSRSTGKTPPMYLALGLV